MTQTPEAVVRELGRRLRDRRIAADLTQSQLASRAGVSRPTVTRLERGANVGLEPFIRIAVALDAAAELGGLFPACDTRSPDEKSEDRRSRQRVRHGKSRLPADPT